MEFIVGWCCLLLLTFWHRRAYLSTATTGLPDWGQAAQIAFQTIFPQLLVFLILLDIERMQHSYLVKELTFNLTGARYESRKILNTPHLEFQFPELKAGDAYLYHPNPKFSIAFHRLRRR